MSVRAVFLDRDGVVNRAIVKDGKPYPPASVEELELTPGAAEALRLLKNAGFPLIIVTNQPDIARGTQGSDVAGRIHARLAEELPIDDFLVCPHDDRDGCECRKPKPGLLIEGARKHEADLRSSFMIGDRWRDIDAGHAAGCRTVFIDYGYRERGPTHAPDASVRSLPEAANWILQQVKGLSTR